jgi:hypothetical protein
LICIIPLFFLLSYYAFAFAKIDSISKFELEHHGTATMGKGMTVGLGPLASSLTQMQSRHCATHQAFASSLSRSP